MSRLMRTLPEEVEECLMNRWVQNLQGIGIFFHGFQSRPLDPKDFCMEATGTPRQSVGFPGATERLP